MDSRASARDASRRRRSFRLGLVVGAAVPVPAAIAALTVPAAERVAPLLVPGALLLRPLSSAMAGWNGAVSMLLLSVVNGLLYGAAAAALAPLLGRRRAPDARRGRVRPRTAVFTVLALLVGAVLAVNALAARHADQAARDLRTVALDAGFDDATEVRVRYPFLLERLGMVSRNEEPFPFGYSYLDLELDGCRLDGVAASLVPHSRSWLPRRVELRDVRFQLEHHEPVSSDTAGTFRRVEFRTADELLDQFGRSAPTGVSAQEHLCRLQPPYMPVAQQPVPAVPAH